ncbi:hypothetical protein [Pimelobacter simplex]|uniref:hypothetical protein n=1 Tax=Nocardioides simplex TaxID=2045 RepID=UPI003AAB1B38
MTDPSAPPEAPEPLEPPEPPAHVLVRWPARVVAVLVVLPVRALWDGFGAAAGLVERFWDGVVVRPWVAFWRWVGRLLRPFGRLLAVPLRWFLAYVARPAGRVLDWCWQYLVLTPTLWLWRVLVAPFGRGILAPIGRALRWAWQVAGGALRTLGGALAVPFRWAHRTLVAPALRWAGRTVVAPVRRAWREVRTQVRRALGRSAR